MSYQKKRPTAVMDLEIYRNYFLAMFRDTESAKRRYFEMYPGKDLDRDGLRDLLRRLRIVTFNGNNFDIPILTLALAGGNCADLKRGTDSIILADVKPWEFYEYNECKPPSYLDHIDLIEVAPGAGSLKIYGGRLHSRRMQDLPIEPDAMISPEERPTLVAYCANDLNTTIDLFNELREQIDLRASMSDEYGVDLRSKSDAQIAEAVIKHEVEKMTGRRLKKPDLERPGRFFYQPPEFVKFRTPNMQAVLKRICNIPLVIGRNGRVQKTEEFDGLEFTIGSSSYKMGIGGLHSQETTRSLYSDDDFVLIDRDVTSYYPRLILNNNLIPPAIGAAFQKVYRSIYIRRLAAKRGKLKAIAETLKIVLNGTFGKLGQPFSLFYAPRQMITVTITGQLSLLMAIERMEMAGIRVISANTDGFTSLVPRDKIDLFNAIMFDWECDTDFETEEVRYRSMHSRSVNAYIAIPFAWDDANKCWDESRIDKPKRKEIYAPSGPGLPASMGLKKNPTTEIATDAVLEYLCHGTPIEQTVERCCDLTRFLAIRQVRGGGMKDGKYLGKAVRWYYAEGETGCITYRESGNNVPKSEGAKPCMDLPTEFPDDIDYNWYIDEAYAIMKDLGVKFVDPHYAGRSGIKHARLPTQKSIHLVDMSNGVALCGKAPPGPRVRWIEFDNMPDGHRLCPRCRREDSL